MEGTSGRGVVLPVGVGLLGAGSGDLVGGTVGVVDGVGVDSAGVAWLGCVVADG